MIKSGKRLEQNFKNSIPEDIYCYRLRDSSSNWSNDGRTRFTPSNIGDYFVYSGGCLYIIELKSHKGKSIPLECIVGNRTKEHQIEDMAEASKYNGVFAYIVVYFEDISRCFALEISAFDSFREINDRKSIPIEYFEKYGIEIEIEALRTNYRLNLDKFFKKDVLIYIPDSPNFDIF